MLNEIDALVRDAMNPKLLPLYNGGTTEELYNQIRLTSPSLIKVRSPLINQAMSRYDVKVKQSLNGFYLEKKHGPTKCNIPADQESGSSIQCTSLAKVG